MATISFHNASDPPVEDRQSCRRCGGVRIQTVMMTTMVVYLRCEDCGEVWNIPQRRNQAVRSASHRPKVADNRHNDAAHVQPDRCLEAT